MSKLFNKIQYKTVLKEHIAFSHSFRESLWFLSTLWFDKILILAFLYFHGCFWKFVEFQWKNITLKAP